MLAGTDEASTLKKDRQIERKGIRLNGNAKDEPWADRAGERTKAEEAAGTKGGGT